MDGIVDTDHDGAKAEAPDCRASKNKNKRPVAILHLLEGQCMLVLFPVFHLSAKAQKKGDNWLLINEGASYRMR